MSLTVLDISDSASVERELAEANELLAESPETPAPVIELVEQLAEALAADGSGEEAGVRDPYLLVELQRAALAARLALDREDPDRRGELRVRLEQMRQAFRDAAAQEPVSERRSGQEIARWLDDVAGVSQQRLADLLGVERRTLQRWVAGQSAPSGEDERRLRVVARLVNHLRHALTPAGVIGWFERERDELSGRAPRELLEEPDALARLETLALGLREPTFT